MHSNVIQKLIATGASLVNIVDYSLDIVVRTRISQFCEVLNSEAIQFKCCNWL